MSVHTFGSLLSRHGVTVPDEMIAEVDVPVLAGPQRQGDVMVVPRPLTTVERSKLAPVPAAGVAVVRGEATGNTHLLHAEGPVAWAPQSDDGVLLGVLDVPPGAVAYLIHTDEHGANGIAAGTYALHGKREQADIIRRVAD